MPPNPEKIVHLYVGTLRTGAAFTVQRKTASDDIGRTWSSSARWVEHWNAGSMSCWKCERRRKEMRSDDVVPRDSMAIILSPASPNCRELLRLLITAWRDTFVLFLRSVAGLHFDTDEGQAIRKSWVVSSG